MKLPYIVNHIAINAEQIVGKGKYIPYSDYRSFTDVNKLFNIKGTNVNAKNKNSDTPLHRVTKYGYKEIN